MDTVDEVKLRTTDDAAVWTTEFLKVVDAGAEIDFGLPVVDG